MAADGAHAPRQDMTQIASHELHAGHGLGAPGAALGAVFPGKGDALLVDGQDSRVADGGAADVADGGVNIG